MSAASDPTGAEVAVAQGHLALQAGDRLEALRWFDRAHRLVPEDPLTTLLLSAALAGRDDARARTLVLALLDTHPGFREARLAMVAIELRMGAVVVASDRLDAALRDAAPPDTPGFRALADQVAAAVGAAGWVGATGRCLLLSTTDDVAVQLDDMLLRPTRRLARRLPAGSVAGLLTARRHGATLLGSGIDLATRFRVEGFVALGENGLEGWAWLPADPDAVPVLTLRDEGDAVLLRLPVGRERDGPGGSSPARGRAFRLASGRLPPAGLLRVTGPDGRDLFGSPLRPHAERRAARAAAVALRALVPASGLPVSPPGTPVLDDWRPLPVAVTPGARSGTMPPRRGVDVVMPVHRGEADFTACLASLLRSLPGWARLVVVDDAAPDAALRRAVAAAAARGAVVVLRHERSLGFPGAANRGLRHACAGVEPRDMVLLNPDTLLPPGWLERLVDAAYAAPDIGSVTPLTGDGTILTYPHPDAPDPPCDMKGGHRAVSYPADHGSLPTVTPDLATTERLDALARAANGTGLVDLPTGIGFCMLIRHDCLAEVGLLREDAFAQGYGEENDWCLRARQLGWRHVAATGVFVTHLGGRSFGAVRRDLMARNLAVLNRLHPGYDAFVARFLAADPLASARLRMDRRRWAEGRQARAVVLVTHRQGGGVERHLRERCETLRRAGVRPIVLRPAAPRPAEDVPEDDRHRLCTVSDGIEDRFPNLRFPLPQQLAALAALLRPDRPLRLEVHHMLGHAPELTTLAALLDVPYDMVVHDYAAWCPRVALCSYGGRYCGEPTDVATCEACVADLGSRIEEDIPVAALRRRSAGLLRAARQVVAPSGDVAVRIARLFPGTAPLVRPWEEDAEMLGKALPPPAGGALRVVVCGAIGPEKGYDVLLGCARDAAHRRLPLSFVLAGYSSDDRRLMEAGVFVTGRFAEDEAIDLVQAQGGRLGFVPSVWPETWCYALSTLWRAGLPVAAFELGAQGERIRRSGRGLLLALGLGAGLVNDALLSAGRRLAGDA